MASNHEIEAARFFHEVTKHSFTSVRNNFHPLDWDNKPLPYKIYPGAGAVALPRALELAGTRALTAVVADTAVAPAADLNLDAITRILFCAGGLTRRRRVGGEEYHFRTAASAGALYPIEMYLSVSAVEELEAGLYHFSPADLKLRGLRHGDHRELLARACAGSPAIVAAPAVVIMTAIFWRTTWKYQERGYRYCFWDAGTMVANLLASTQAERVPARLIAAFNDAEMEPLLGIDGVTEGLVCMVPLGEGVAAALEPFEASPIDLATVPLSRDSRSYEDLIRIHQASRLTQALEVAAAATASVRRRPAIPAGASVALPKPDLGRGLGLGETILRRGSTRRFARESIEAEELSAILAACAAPFSADFPPMVDTYLIVNAVRGIEAGAYYHDALGHALESIKPGSLRQEAGYICLEQDLGADCSALLIFMTDLEAALEGLGNRAYREIHLEAGLRGGRAYLAAYALGRGATGLTFYDDDTIKLLLPHSAEKTPLLMVAVGVPE